MRRRSRFHRRRPPGRGYLLSPTIELYPGDCLLALTDGITEAMNPEKKLFGAAGVEASERAFSSEEANPLMSLMDAVRRFEVGEPASDDVAVILMRHLTLTTELQNYHENC
jgi:serine phosphatase RsbU (regulator of sigma subunit)